MSPNSFYGVAKDLDHALNIVDEMIHDGADFLDIGGEGTNPFVDIDKEAPSIQQEIDRVAPAINAIKKRFDTLVSIDTRNGVVMQAAIEAGVDLINDQRALKGPGAVALCAKHKMPVCLMHFPDPMRVPDEASKQDLYDLVIRESLEDAKRCEAGGITANKIILDPGFGGGNFGKSAAENFFMLKHFQRYCDLGYPVLSGWSRKSMIGDVLVNKAPDRLAGSLAAAMLSLQQGAQILRVHDVKPTVDTVKIYQAMVEA